ncbi:MAG TPA: hypothetical protein VM238_13830 [Phycisphaerae bacterium]|nr:hypothetical protein [Phycisphaerae bacterium]
MPRKKAVPYVLLLGALAVLALMLSPVGAPEGKYEPFILGLPYTAATWTLGSLVFAALGIALGIWASRQAETGK